MEESATLQIDMERPITNTWKNMMGMCPRSISCVDANNLYGWAMSQYLPTDNFRWMTDKETNKIGLGKYKADGKKGLIFEVDLEYL